MKSTPEEPASRYHVWIVEFHTGPSDEGPIPATARIVGLGLKAPLSRREAHAFAEGFNQETGRRGGNRRAFVWRSESEESNREDASNRVA
jgi:hypothetical protein